MSIFLDLNNVCPKNLLELINSSQTKADVLRSLGFPGRSDQHLAILNNLIKKHKISISHFKTSFKFDIEVLNKHVKSSICFKEVGVKLGKAKMDKPMSSKWHKKIKQAIEDNKIDCSHFNSAKVRMASEYLSKRYENSEIFKKGADVSKQTLKVRYLKIRKKNYECDTCGVSKWNKMNISLQLDHIDGNSLNNELTNLRLLCPNCHSQTPTFCGRHLRFTGQSSNIDKKLQKERQSLTECLPKTHPSKLSFSKIKK